MKVLEDAINRIKTEAINNVIKEIEWAKNRHPFKPTDDEYLKGLKSGLQIGLNVAYKSIKKEFNLKEVEQ